MVNNNHSLGQCIDPIHRAYGGRAGNKDEMCIFKDVNFAQIAKEMGCFGIRVKHPDEISDSLMKALSSDLPAVVDVVTDVNCRVPSPWTPSKTG